ncbi:MAG: molybdopterin-guanine dinucleotide biosynthesis protein B [Anaerolineae bacterium]|nr:molybdopterin-guanine dinucleotide biosynthesis protein B [Anaerolineae bacterium]
MVKIPVIAFIGHSGSGKTTLLERVVGQLVSSGIRTGVVKHTRHIGVPSDLPGTDTRRLWDVGASQVVLASPDRLTHWQRCEREIDLDVILSRITDVDLIILEGFKTTDAPKIEVLREAHNPQPLRDIQQRIAFVTDAGGIKTTLPCFDLDDVNAVVEFIIDSTRKNV